MFSDYVYLYSNIAFSKIALTYLHKLWGTKNICQCEQRNERINEVMLSWQWDIKGRGCISVRINGDTWNKRTEQREDSRSWQQDIFNQNRTYTLA